MRFTFGWHRIPLKEEKHYLKVHHLRDGEEIPIFFAPKEGGEGGRREGRNEREKNVPAQRLRVLAVSTTRSFPCLSTLCTALPLPPDIPGTSRSLTLLPAHFFLLPQHLFPCRLPHVLTSCSWALGKLFQTHRQGWRPLTGWSPTATRHASPAAPVCPHTRCGTKKGASLALGAQRGKCHLSTVKEVQLTWIFRLLITTTKQRRRTANRRMFYRHSCTLHGDKAPLCLPQGATREKFYYGPGTGGGGCVWFFYSVATNSLFIL